MLGIEKDVNQSVKDYEKNFYDKNFSEQAYLQWKSKYGYIGNFIKFPYKRLGLSSSYKKQLKKYFSYFNKKIEY